MTPAEAEATRQALLLAALWHEAGAAALAPQLRRPERGARGLAAYRANAGASAERALAAAYPVVQQLLGEESFGALARTLWLRHPPARGDLAQWGEALAEFVAADPALAEEPYLADVARLEWALHQAASAADDEAPVQGFDGLQDEAAWSHLRFVARAGTALVISAHPIATIVQAHAPLPAGSPPTADRFAPVRAAFAAGTGEAVLVWRAGWAVRHAVLPAAEAAFTRALLAGTALLPALKACAADFDFESWLVAALRQGWLGGVTAGDHNKEHQR
jgi:hypothetical protein